MELKVWAQHSTNVCQKNIIGIKPGNQSSMALLDLLKKHYFKFELEVFSSWFAAVQASVKCCQIPCSWLCKGRGFLLLLGITSQAIAFTEVKGFTI